MDARGSRLVLSKGGANSEHLGEAPSPERAHEEQESMAALEFEGRPLERVEQMTVDTAAIDNPGNTPTGETP